MRILHDLDGRRPPMLFIGPGIVRRYVRELPSWRDVLLRASVRMGMPKSEFRELPEDDMPATASAVEAYLHESIESGRIVPEGFLTEDELFEFRRGKDIFKIVCASEMGWERIEGMKVSSELRAFSKLQDVVPAVFTTCTDDFLPTQVFPGFGRTTSISRMFPSDDGGIGELFMIMGCSADPDSLILTEADVEVRRRSTGLFTARMVSLISEYPLVFMGYDPHDPVIEYVARDLARVVGPRKAVESIIIMDSEPAGYFEDIRTSLLLETPEGAMNLRVTSTDYMLEVYQEIADMKPRISPLELRRMRRMIGDIVLSRDFSDAPYDVEVGDGMTEERRNGALLVLMNDRGGLIWDRRDTVG